MGSIEEIDDSLETRGIAPWYPGEFLPSKIPLGLSSFSSVAKSESKPIEAPQSPQLEAPQETYQLGLIRGHLRLEQLAGKYADLLNQQSDQSNAEIDQLELEKKEILHKRAKVIETYNTWNTWKVVAQYLSSGATIALGMAASTNLLIAAGAMSLVNRILQDTGALNKILAQFIQSEEGQQKWANRIEMGLFLTSLGLGFAGGIAAYRSGAFAAGRHVNAEGIKKTIEETVAIASTAMGATTQFGAAYENKKLAKLQRRLLDINSELQLIDWNFHTNAKQADNWIGEVGERGRTTQRIISDAKVSLDS